MAILQATTLILLIAATVSGSRDDSQSDENDSMFCPPIVPDKNLNEKWLRSIEFWFIAGGSKRDFLKGLRIGLSPSEYKRISIRDIQSTCFLMSAIRNDATEVEVYGMNRRLFGAQLSFRPHRKGILDFFVDGVHAYTTYIVLTDNKNYRLQIDENSDGQRDFRLATVAEHIPDSEWPKIYATLKKYGFSKSQIFYVKQSCESDKYVNHILEGGDP